jgi:hypothetical protein
VISNRLEDSYSVIPPGEELPPFWPVATRAITQGTLQPGLARE